MVFIPPYLNFVDQIIFADGSLELFALFISHGHDCQHSHCIMSGLPAGKIFHGHFAVKKCSICSSESEMIPLSARLNAYLHQALP